MKNNGDNPSCTVYPIAPPSQPHPRVVIKIPLPGRSQAKESMVGKVARNNANGPRCDATVRSASAVV